MQMNLMGISWTTWILY